MRTSDRKLNKISPSFPRGVVIGTADLIKQFPVMQENLRKAFRGCVTVVIHGYQFRVADEPLGEPPGDIEIALARERWERIVWELGNVRPLPKPIGFSPSRGSSWTKVKLTYESDLTSYF